MFDRGGLDRGVGLGHQVPNIPPGAHATSPTPYTLFPSA